MVGADAGNLRQGHCGTVSVECEIVIKHSPLLKGLSNFAYNTLQGVNKLDHYAEVSVSAKHRDSKLRFGELLPVSVAFKTSHTALEADCPDNSGI